MLFWHFLVGLNENGIKRRILVGFIRCIIYHVNTKIPREKIIKVFMIICFCQNGLINLFIILFEGKLHNVFVNFA